MIDNKTLFFDGTKRVVFQKTCEIKNSFTYEFWIRAEETQSMDQEQSDGVDGLLGKNYLVGPDFYPEGSAGCGISIGTNGISVYEHSVNHLPARLVSHYDFSDWQHVAVVSDNKTLRLFINGEFIKEEGAPCVVDYLIPSLSLGGHVYGTFKGQVREFRLWSSVRTEEEIKAQMFLRLSGEEEHLYFYRDPDRGINVSNGIKRDIVVSIIIPSYNRCPLNYFTLLSLERQDFPLQQMEVIFLDDDSTDATSSMYDILNPAFPLIYMKLMSNIGRSKVRNLGSSIAAGRIFIFIDAEMICGPDFVRHHANHHLSGENRVVSGAMRPRRIYTISDPHFSPDQIMKMKECYSGHPIAEPLIERFMKGENSPFQLLPFELMLDPAHLKQWSMENSYFEDILSTYGTGFKQFHYSWMNVITCNVSMTKSLFEETGGFDEEFEGFGWEDWEFGYQAALKGAIFIHDDAVVNFHQEHPIQPGNEIQSRWNFLRLCDKYPNSMEIKLLALTMVPDWVTLQDINGYVTELNQIRAIYSGGFIPFNQYIDTAVHLILVKLCTSENITLPIADYVVSPLEKIAVQTDISAIKELGCFPKLLELYERLSRYFYKI